eukprot:UN31795
MGFYDQTGQYWTCVGTAQNQHDFAQAVALAKLSTTDLNNAHPLIMQDYTPLPTSGQTLTNKDICKIKLELYFPHSKHHPKALGKKLYNQDSMTVKLATPKAPIGVSEGCIGLKKGSKRLLIIPPHKAYGKNGNKAIGVGANQTIIAVIEVLKCKFGGTKAKTTPRVHGPQVPKPQTTTTATNQPTTEQPIAAITNGQLGEPQALSPQSPMSDVAPQQTQTRARGNSLSKIAKIAQRQGVKRMILPGMQNNNNVVQEEPQQTVQQQQTQQPTP